MSMGIIIPLIIGEVVTRTLATHAHYAKLGKSFFCIAYARTWG